MPNEKNKAYVCGPMRHWLDLNFDAFAEATAHYRDLGWEVVNPHELDAARGIDGRNMTDAEMDAAYPALIKEDLEILETCTHIICLPHRENSDGARDETNKAAECGLKFTYYTPEAAMIKLDDAPHRTFSTGSTRSDDTGKSRPDLISPLFLQRVNAYIHELDEGRDIKSVKASLFDNTLAIIAGHCDTDYIALAALDVMKLANPSPPYFPFVNPSFIERAGYHMAAGAKEHSPHNWARGQNTQSTMGSLLRHVLSVLAGHADEDHISAAFFNLMNLDNTQRLVGAGKLPAELDDAKRWCEDYEQARPESPTRLTIQAANGDSFEFDATRLPPKPDPQC